MRISDLARESGVSVATVKYYLREGLLPPGRLTATTQAQYGDEHVERLRLVRALLGPAGLSIAQVRRVLALVDEDRDVTFDLLGAVQHATADATTAADLAPALALVERAGWRIRPDSPEIAQLAAALAALGDAGFAIPERNLEAYLETSRIIADAEIANIPGDDPREALRYTVLGTILVEPLLLALRRLAQQDAALRRFGVTGPDRPRPAE
jgi:DNA-binding transcriptional MerR regulator